MANRWIDIDALNKEKEAYYRLESPDYSRGLIFGGVPTSYKGSSTKEGSSPKAIAKRRKRNKNKKTHRK